MVKINLTNLDLTQEPKTCMAIELRIKFMPESVFLSRLIEYPNQGQQNIANARKLDAFMFNDTTSGKIVDSQTGKECEPDNINAVDNMEYLKSIPVTVHPDIQAILPQLTAPQVAALNSVKIWDCIKIIVEQTMKNANLANKY